MKRIASILPVVLQFFIACQKTSPGNGSNPGNGPGQGSGTLLKTFTLVTFDPSGGTKVDSTINSYNYDAQNRLLTIVVNDYDASGQLIIDSAFETYTSTSIAETRQQWKAGVKQQTVSTTYYLNTAGNRPDSSHQTTVKYPGPVTTENISKYSFDGNGFLTNEKVYLLENNQRDLVTEIACTVANGNTNTVNITIYILPGNPLSGFLTSTAFGFSNQVASNAMIASTGNAINSVIGIASNGINLMHADNNLVQSATVSVMGNVAETETIAYAFDAQNRFSKVNYKLSTGNTVVIAYYSY